TSCSRSCSVRVSSVLGRPVLATPRVYNLSCELTVRDTSHPGRTLRRAQGVSTRPARLISLPGPAPKECALCLDEKPGQQVRGYRGSGSDARVLSRHQGRGNGQAELVDTPRGGQVAHEVWTAFTEDSP